MGDLLVRGLSDSVKASLADKAKQGGRSLSEEAKLRLVQSLVDDEQNPRRYENAFSALRRAFIEADAILSNAEHEDFMRAIEEVRKDMGRPAPDFE